MFHLRTQSTKYRSSAFKMSPFLAIDNSFATKAFRTGQRNFYMSGGVSKWVSEIAIVFDNPFITLCVFPVKNDLWEQNPVPHHKCFPFITRTYNGGPNVNLVLSTIDVAGVFVFKIRISFVRRTNKPRLHRSLKKGNLFSFFPIWKLFAKLGHIRQPDWSLAICVKRAPIKKWRGSVSVYNAV